jgi:hypothetical protein
MSGERFTRAIRDAKAPAWAIDTGPGAAVPGSALHCTAPACEAETARLLADGGSGAPLSKRTLDKMAESGSWPVKCDHCGVVLALPRIP